MTAHTRVLPEKFRLGRNLEQKFEIHAVCDQHPDGHWLPITHVLRVLAPLKVSSFTLTPPDCMPDMTRVGCDPREELMSPRPAVTA